MADEHDGAFQLVLQVQQFILQPGADQRVKRRKRLIHQQDRGIGDKGAGQTDALLHAAAKLSHLAVGPLRQADQRQLRLDPVLAGGVVDARKFQPQTDIFTHGSPGQQAELLEHHGDHRQAQPAQRGGIGMGDRGHLVAVQHPHVAAAHPVQPVDGPQQGGFARPRQAHQHQYLAIADRQGAVMHPQHLRGGFLDFGAALPLIHQRQGHPGVVAKHDVDGIKLNSILHHFTSRRSIRSSAMASATITDPASNP